MTPDEIAALLTGRTTAAEVDVVVSRSGKARVLGLRLTIDGRVVEITADYDASLQIETDP